MSEEEKPQEPVNTETSAPRTGAGVRHLAMVVCILLGVFFYAGWRVKTQQGPQAKPQGAMDTLHTFLENVRAGLTGKPEARNAPIPEAVVPPVPAQAQITPLPMDGMSGRPSGMTAGRADVPPAAVRPAGSSSDVLLQSSTDAGSSLLPSAELSGGTAYAPGVTNTVGGVPGLEGLALPGEPAAGATSAATGTLPAGGAIGSVSERSPQPTVIPGAVAKPTKPGRLNDLYDKLKNDPVLQDNTPDTGKVTTTQKTAVRQPGRKVAPAVESKAPITTTVGNGRAPLGVIPAPEGGKGEDAGTLSSAIPANSRGKAPATAGESPKPAVRETVRETTKDAAHDEPKEQPRGATTLRDTADSPDHIFIYTVQRQDTLGEIAEKYLGARTRAKEVFEANRDQMARPDQLRVGMRLRIPGAVRPDSPLVHVVTASDSLPSLAVRYFGSADPDAIAEMRRANPALSHGGFKPGLRLVIPSKSAAKERGMQRASAENDGSRKPTVSEYVVKSGDNLRKIAASVYGDGDRWKEIFDANRTLLKFANNIQAGQKLTIPQ